MGMNITAMAMNIRINEPENHIMRDSDANTAVSSLAITLPQANSGDRKNVNTARMINLLGSFSSFCLHIK